MNENIEATTEELAYIRSLPDFDLIMILSEINDHGWAIARKTLKEAVIAVHRRKNGDSIQ